MELFFKFIQLLKGLISSDHGVEYVLPEIANKVDNFKVKISTRINTYDSAIVTRHYEVVGYTPTREKTNLYRATNSSAIKEICSDITTVIHQQSGVKIPSRKLFNAVKKRYVGKLIVDGITIEFIQTW